MFGLGGGQKKSAEERSQGLAKAVEDMTNEMDKSYIRPEQKRSFECCAHCCDISKDQQALMNCVDQCQLKVSRQQNVVNQLMQDFQNRLQRCAVRCNDMAKEMLPANPTQQDYEKAQEKGKDCIADCSEEYEKQVPKLRKDLEDALRRV
eukprot:TRINITY_DN3671_c0_g1_i1.p1 TRINITY_DN3671_c0_g1~~TRINITY_DN3671_c0_g1_i1.p1  ORF type:complete len:149 (-),score=26.80 TRINITY_DN3671_c0_g1_i1:189-635(-)